MTSDDPSVLWTLAKDGRTMAGQVRLVPYGIEIDILRDGAVLVTRTFESGDEALVWAEEKRAARVRDGWTDAAGGRERSDGRPAGQRRRDYLD
jgi:hypothetical protein